MLIAKTVTAAEYRSYLESRALRHFHTQQAEYIQTKALVNTPTRPILFYREEGTGEPVGAALVIFYRYKRFFRRATCLYGPLLEESSPEILKEAVEALKRLVWKDVRTRVLEILPLIVVKRYTRVPESDQVDQTAEVWENPQTAAYQKALEELGMNRIPREFYEDSRVQIRIVYTKELAQSFDETAASFQTTLRNHMQQARSRGVRVRFLTQEELPQFLQMLEATYDRIATDQQAPTDFFSPFFQTFRDRVWVPLAEVDLEQALTYFPEKYAGLAEEESKLRRKLGDKPETPKFQKQIRAIEDKRVALQKQEEQVLKLRKENGNILPLSSGFFVQSGREMLYLFGAGYGDRMFFNGQAAMHEAMVRLAIDRGCTCYNLFGCSGLPDSNNPVDRGVQRFKQTFNGQFEELLGTYTLHKGFPFAR